MAIGRLRYTHKLLIQNNTNVIFSGSVARNMTPSATQPTVPFKLKVVTDNTSTVTGLKVTGLLDGVIVTENINSETADTVYSENSFDSITSLTSRSFYAGTTISIETVDDAFQPVFWQTTSGPFNCTFSTVDGMASGIQSESIGQRTVINHYVRLPYRAPVYKNMEFTISPGYSGKTFVPITDFDIVCIPPKYIPVEWAFRCTEKEET